MIILRNRLAFGRCWRGCGPCCAVHDKGGEIAELLRAGEIVLDRTAILSELPIRLVDLTPSEFELLAVLLGSPGRAFSRLDLLERISGDFYEGYERTIDVHIRNLRAKIELNRQTTLYRNGLRHGISFF